MATWPSATKASTANLDSGTDSPASARADLKTNVDNVNSVIDMFNIGSPTDNQILQYSTANSRFEVATPSGFVPASPGDIGATTPAAASFTTLTFKNPIEALYDIGTTGGTIAPDPANGSVQKITLNSALTLNAFTNPTAGESLTLIIYGGTAYTSITSTMKFAGGVKTLTATAGCIDIVSIYYDGTNYFASLGKGYA
jgi:hypothetical protein